MVSNKKTAPAKLRLAASNAGNVARAAWIIVEMSILDHFAGNTGKIALHELINPKTGTINTQLPIAIDPYAFFVYLSSAVRMGLVVCTGGEVTFHPSIPTVKWFSDNGEKVRTQGFTNALLSDLFKHVAEVV